MICVTITPESRTLAKVDLLNASRMGDIIELCIDHLIKEPEFKELLTAIDKPVIISCRREQDGGNWKGSEQERIMLLKQAIMAGPAYIELELDIADQIPRFGNTERVISVNCSDHSDYEIDELYSQAVAKHADVVKFIWPTPTLDESWPLLAAVSKKKTIPIVGIGSGRPEITFSLLGRKYGSPWIYAALEKGMEAHPGQPSVHELSDIYHWDEIDRNTRFVGIGGFDQSATRVLTVLNAGFKAENLNIRCLPLAVGRLQRLEKMLDILKIQALVTDEDLGGRIHPMVQHVDKVDLQSGFLSLVVKQPDGWHGYNAIWRKSLQELEQRIGAGNKSGPTSRVEKPLKTKSVMVLGTGKYAETMVMGITGRSGIVSIASIDDKASEELARQHNARFVPLAKIYDTLVDIYILTDKELTVGTNRLQINPSLFRAGNFVLDICHLPYPHPLAEEAKLRGCTVINHEKIFEDQMQSLFKMMTNKTLPPFTFDPVE